MNETTDPAATSFATATRRYL